MFGAANADLIAPTGGSRFVFKSYGDAFVVLMVAWPE